MKAIKKINSTIVIIFLIVIAWSSSLFLAAFHDNRATDEKILELRTALETMSQNDYEYEATESYARKFCESNDKYKITFYRAQLWEDPGFSVSFTYNNIVKTRVVVSVKKESGQKKWSWKTTQTTKM